jgi:CBS domain-containing protein
MKARPTVLLDDNVKAVVEIMVTKGIRAVPVVDTAGHIRGIVTRSRVVNFVLDYM